MTRLRRTLTSLTLLITATSTVAGCAVLGGTTGSGSALGPYAVSTSSVPSSAGFGGGTVYYPTNATGRRAIISLAPGFTESGSALADWGPTLASNGFVTIIINVSSYFAFPDQRSTEQLQALSYLVTQGQTAGTVLNGKVDGSRKGIGGHSMGGGGTLVSERSDPSIKAAVPMAPWNTDTNYAKVTTPTLIWGCQSDTTAPESSHATPMYNSIPATTPKMYVSVAGQGHQCANSSSAAGGVVGSTTVAFYKHFLDGAASTVALCGASKPPVGSVFDAVQSTCPF